MPVVDQERSGQAQQSFHRQESHLPAASRRAARGLGSDLRTGRTRRQVQVIR
jgi:hypothetical protein